MDYNLITILGPTATGKTRLASQIAYHFNGEIISADSRQVYKGMNIGTGKDYEDYVVNGETIPCNLIDLVDPSEEFNLFLFKDYFIKIFGEIAARKKLPLLCGGTGLYLSSVLRNYHLDRADPGLKGELEKLPVVELNSLYLSLNKNPHNTTDLKDKNRLITSIMILKSEPGNFIATDFVNSLNIGINPGREEIKKRITTRLKKRLESGMIDEVKTLMSQGVSYEKMVFFGLEYKYIAQHLKGEVNYNDMFQKLNSAIHNFAKRQMTWFRKMEKEGIIIHWLKSNDFNSAKLQIENVGFRSS
jgi:tRNA dimethylallyltransferase